MNGKTLSELVRERAAGREGDRVAYIFLADGGIGADARSMTWAQLDQRASALGASLRERGAAGERVLLALPSGLEFIESIFACWYAGAIAVPVSLPRHQRVKHRLDGIVADAGARFAIGSLETRDRLNMIAAEGAAATLTWTDVDAERAGGATQNFVFGEAHEPALLQYTSGSTGRPRGVIVTHSNLMHNSALIAEAGGNSTERTTVGWLPLFHDMGLVGLVLQAAYFGSRCVFMSPERFLMRPWLWLKMISDYRAETSPAPNFAYDLCAEKIGAEQKATLDLSCWRNAFNGSEAVRGATLDRFAAAFAGCGFRREAFFPCYGLAEATLFVTGPGDDRRLRRRAVSGELLAKGDEKGHLSCGRAFGDTRIAIVDPVTRRRVVGGAVGEVWVAGGSCAAGYWNNAEATAATFGARLDSADAEDAGCEWLRTGDLGFIVEGELFITGRLRELIIVYGRNYFPVDIERTVESADAAIAASAAFSVDGGGVEKLIVVAEVRRDVERASRADGMPVDGEAICKKMRAAVVAEHEVAPAEVLLVCSGALPRTTSGKLSRHAARQAYLDQALQRWESRVYVDAGK